MNQNQDVLTACPGCGAPINQNLNRWERARTSCGSDRCRKAISRENQRKREAQEKAETRQRVRQYCETLTPENRAAILRIMAEHGHELAAEIIDILDSVRCKHDKIALIEEHAAAAHRRADKAAEHNEQLEQLYKRRIQELEAEVQVYQSLENAIHGIASRQLERQSE
jgi:hypothetical protein